MDTREQFKSGDILSYEQHLIFTLDFLQKQRFVWELLKDEPRTLTIQSLCPQIASFIESIVLHESIIVPLDPKDMSLVSNENKPNNIIKCVAFESSITEQAEDIIKNSDRIQETVRYYTALLSNHVPDKKEEIERDYPQKLLADFINDFRWLIFAFKYGLSTSFTPYRISSGILNEEVKKIGWRENGNVYGGMVNRILNEVETNVKKRTSELNNLISKERFRLDAPIIFNFVLEKAHKREDILPVAFNVRESKEARAFRKHLAILDEATMVGDDKLLIPLIEELHDKIKSLRNKLEQPSIEIQVSIPLAISFNPFDLLKHINPKRKRHLLFIEQLYNTGMRARPISTWLNKLL